MKQTAALFCLVTVLLGAAASSTPAAADPETLVLDTTGFWRLFHELRPPEIETAEGVQPILLDRKWLDTALPGPPTGWREPTFDDATWLRGPARIAADSHYLYRLCLRGRFTVTDPEKVKDLRVTLGYRGGAVVTVNGTEIARGHLPKGVLGRDVRAASSG